MIILCLYIDDLLTTRRNEGYFTDFKGDLMKEFKMIDLGLMTYFVGIEFHKSKKGFLMHQKRNAREILKKLEMKHCNVAITHANPNCSYQRMKTSKILI